jgi:uncharacterized protein YbcI
MEPTERTRQHLGTAISNAVVRCTAVYTGRGPTHARTTIDKDTIVCIVRDALTKSERALIAKGKGDDVLRTRRAGRDAMRADLIAEIEALTGREVVAFLSDQQIDPDVGCAVFVLESAREA